MATKRGPRVVRGRREIVGDIKLVNGDAAGIDAESREHWVSVPEDRDEQSVRPFGAFTEDLYALSDWLAACAIRTVAIEATGVYWIPLVEVLEARGFEVRLVDSRSIGRRNKKTDVLDCQWIRQLHSYGLLDGAFRPEADMLVASRIQEAARNADPLCVGPHSPHAEGAGCHESEAAHGRG